MGENPFEERSVPDPAQIATYLFSKLRRAEPNVTQWDLLCLGAQCFALATLENPAFKGVALEANKLVYTIHDHYKDRIDSCLKSVASEIKQEQSQVEPQNSELPSVQLSLMTDEQLRSL